MEASFFYNEKLEKEIFGLTKFFIKFYKNNINDVQRKVISNYRGWSNVNYLLLGLDKSLDLIKEYMHDEKSKILEKALKTRYRYMYEINQLDNLFRIVPAYNKKIVTYRGIQVCNDYKTEVNLKNMVYELERSKIGEDFLFSTFLSTSLDPYIAIYNFALPSQYASVKDNNKKYINKLKTTCDDLYELFGKKYFLLMKINIPKGKKFLYFDIVNHFSNENKKDKIYIWENEILLPRNSKLKLIKRYDKQMNMKKPTSYFVNNILKNTVEHEKIPTRVYEFEYIDYEDSNMKMELDIFLEFNKDKTYLKEIEKQVEDEYIIKQTNNKDSTKLEKSKKDGTKKADKIELKKSKKDAIKKEDKTELKKSKKDISKKKKIKN